MREYVAKRRDDLEPHLFAVAEEAYRNMINLDKNQSIIVSGESGAGKTQSAKYIMRYLAMVGDLDLLDTDTQQIRGRGELEQSVLLTNPILEAFGNSKTTRNDNSSRFGKYIEIWFSRPDSSNKSVRITGAKIRTYLLERSRLIFQPASERNYHIFYQLCAGVPAAERKESGLGHWNDYHYLNQGGTGTIEGFDDVAEFTITQQSMSQVGISVANQWDLFKICSAILHLGNIVVSHDKGDLSFIAEEDHGLIYAAKLLCIDPKALRKWILHKKISTTKDSVLSQLTVEGAIACRDSIAKFVYSKLFDWLVTFMNKNLSSDDGGAAPSVIGVLDIYGFEKFEKNSFEQFCINYANEKLQQEFNKRVFKLEQDEYVSEEISWTFIDFNDNQPCIDMLDKKLGIFDMLDEETKLPYGTETALISKLFQQFGNGKHASFGKSKSPQTFFQIRHYAMDVNYSIEGFIDKNRDAISEDLLEVLCATEFPLLKEILRPEENYDKKADRRLSRKHTLSSVFRSSLSSLMETIQSTQTYYIRCIKPNDKKLPFGFDPQLALSQLRACGVLETIRISCAVIRGSLARSRYMIMVQNVNALLIQTAVRRWLAYRRYVKLRNAAIAIQSTIRMHLARQRYHALRCNKAAVTIQRIFRGWRVRRSFVRNVRLVVLIQSCVRRRLAKRIFKKRKAEARSLGKLTEKNYKLEHKVVELSQLLQSRELDFKALTDRFRTAENQIQYWKEKCFRASSMVKSNEAGFRAELKSLMEQRDADAKKIEQLERQVLRLETENTELKTTNKKLSASGFDGKLFSRPPGGWRQHAYQRVRTLKELVKPSLSQSSTPEISTVPSSNLSKPPDNNDLEEKSIMSTTQTLSYDRRLISAAKYSHIASLFALLLLMIVHITLF
ncbi:Myosin type-2 heavy chain 1 [Blyttiomyces sp. JEL0837]|nr:Myosin type-2 heavy chain 1 [Blyttiomyces sp. JEL0837]